MSCPECVKSRFPLHHASLHNHLGCAEAVLESDAPQLDIVNADGSTALHIASLNGNCDIAKLLVLRGANTNSRDRFGASPLDQAAFSNHLECTKILIAGGADVNALDFESGTALHKACVRGSIEVAKLLIVAGANVTLADDGLLTPLMNAAFAGVDELVNLLIRSGASMTARDLDGSTALHKAAFNGHVKVIETLLDKGAPIAARDVNGMTALHLAAYSDNDEALKFLLNFGADIESKADDGSTALHLAVLQGSVKSVKALLEAKANVNVADRYARSLPWSALPDLDDGDDDTYDAAVGGSATPLHVAAWCGDAAMIKLLLSAGAILDGGGNGGPLGCSALHCAVSGDGIGERRYVSDDDDDDNSDSGSNEFEDDDAVRCCRVLLNEKASLSRRNHRGDTPLMAAVRANSRACVIELLAALKRVLSGFNGSPVLRGGVRGRGARGGVQRGRGAGNAGARRMPPMMVQHGGAIRTAAAEGNKEMLALLIERCGKEKVNLRDPRGRSALHLAASAGATSCVELLLENGADVNARDVDGVTPLASSGSRSVATILLNNGATVDAKANNGEQPLHTIALTGNSKLCKLLIEKGGDVNAVDNDQSTALHLAAFSGLDKVVSVLLDANANPAPKDSTGLTPLHSAAYRGHSTVVKKLLSAGAKVDVQDDAGAQALHAAALRGHAKCVKVLLSSGAQTNAKNNDGAQALHFSAGGGHKSLVKLLLEHGADINATDDAQRNALHFAAHHSHASVVQTLLHNGADVTALERDGNNALHLAAAGGNKSCVLKLAQSAPKASLLRKNASGQTPYDVAVAHKHDHIAPLLSTDALDDDDDDDDNGIAAPPLPDDDDLPASLASPNSLESDAVDMSSTPADDDDSSGDLVVDVAPPLPRSTSKSKKEKKSSKKDKRSKSKNGSRILSASSPSNPSSPSRAESGSRIRRRPSRDKPQGAAPSPNTARRTLQNHANNNNNSTNSKGTWQRTAPSLESKVSLIMSAIDPNIPKRPPIDAWLSLLLSSNHQLLRSLLRTVSINDADRVAKPLLVVFERAGDAAALLHAAVKFEVARTTDSAQLFRANSLATKLLAQLAIRHGREYLVAVLVPTIANVLRRRSALEIDPNKLVKPGEDISPEIQQIIQENTQSLVSLFHDFADAIFNSVARLPLSLRSVCQTLARQVGEKFGDDYIPMAVGGFIFLRFIAPAIVTPDGGAQLVSSSDVSKEARRTLLLISKVIIQLANGVKQFGMREPYMAPLNGLLGEQAAAMREFLIALTDRVADAAIQRREVSDEDTIASLNGLHKHFSYNFDKLTKDLDESKQYNSAAITLNENLCNVMEELGKPPLLVPLEQHQAEALKKAERDRQLAQKPKQALGTRVGNAFAVIGNW